MKVLHLITSSRSFFEQQIDALEERGVECTVLPVPGEYRPDSPRSIVDYLRYYPQVLREVQAEAYDLVHANYGLLAPVALAQPVRPVVLTLWGTDLMSDMAWLRALSRSGAQFSDAVVLPSQPMAAQLDCDHEVIPFGVDTERFRPMARDRARNRLGWDTDERVVCFPYDPSRAVKDYPRARSIVDRAAVDAQLRTVTGVPHEEMPYYLNASDVLLITSRRESGPMTVKEAAACNLPVVSTDVGFVRDVLADVTNSAVCESDIALIAALEYILENRNRSNGREAIDELGIDAMGDRLVALYDRTLDRTDADRRSVESREVHDGR